MRLAILNTTAGGLSSGHIKYLHKIIPHLLNNKEVSRLFVALPVSADFNNWQTLYPSIEWAALKPSIFRLSGIDINIKERIMNFSPDVIFIPTSRFWRIKGIPTVNMVQNMQPMANLKTNNFLNKFKLKLQYEITRHAVIKANRVIAVSEYVKQFLISKWNLPIDKIAMIYYGCDIKTGEHIDNNPPLSLPKELNKDAFLFTAGSICDYRGLEDIINALGYLKNKNTIIPDVLIAGKVLPLMYTYEHNLKKSIEKNGISEKIHWLGKLQEDEMRWCYDHCALFLMTSRVEACPNIALEAMSHACLCISTKNPPMPEFFKDLAVYYNAGDGIGLADAINAVLGWANIRKLEIARQVKECAAGFSWQKTVEDTIKEFKLVIKSSKELNQNS